MSDKQYRVTIQIACDATVIDKIARMNMSAVDDAVEKLSADHKGSAITVAVTETANIVTVREKSDKPRAKRGSALADELAALKAKVEEMAHPLVVTDGHYAIPDEEVIVAALDIAVGAADKAGKRIQEPVKATDGSIPITDAEYEDLVNRPTGKRAKANAHAPNDGAA